ncbi:MAG: hypothetical protein IKU45_01335 [Clostridia bacterium]|nr:hypothetical protein [Clostridia bacterium]
MHFLYDWTNKNIISAAFSGVNESTWEHMKLLFFPWLIFALFESLYVKNSNFWCVKLVGILYGLFSIPIIFYTYNGAVGKSPDWLNIGIFFVAAAITFYAETKLLKKNTLSCSHPYVPLGIICLVGIMFIVFTFFPPHINIFKDPLTNTYGIAP